MASALSAAEQTATGAGPGIHGRLDFLWLELTNRCNLRCVHCYTDSHPHAGDRDILALDDYLSLLRQAFDLGCRKVQLIGGEPQLNRDFFRILEAAVDMGFEFIEVFTNLTHLDETTLRYSAEHGIHFATSVYSAEPAEHDAITGVRTSHARTTSNLRRLIDQGIETRAAVIALDQEAPSIVRTKRYLKDMGVPEVRHSEVREFGRGQNILDREANLQGLCGHCWSGKLCIAPDGDAYPCVMARHWPVGNVREASLAEIVGGMGLKDMRQEIYTSVWLPKLEDYRARQSLQNGIHAKACMPGSSPPDTDPGEKNPDGTDNPDPEECPQSCVPTDGKTCGPHACPQSCTPFIVVCEPTGDE
ncbi:radical SAM protein [Microvirga pudoricolor]|uniref:radical SAM protein n=1 Tax=Microvirga pudoricolor TaxID=2778729 RepID=UPI00194E4AEF|nr:radical SAM protein [Microvirga pudoricolor]MBM6595912.1 radical SAM protein [Microvirga pudoricolor]